MLLKLREVLIPAVKKFFNEVLTNEKKIILSEEAEIFRYEN